MVTRPPAPPPLPDWAELDALRAGEAVEEPEWIAARAASAARPGTPTRSLGEILGPLLAPLTAGTPVAPAPKLSRLGRDKHADRRHKPKRRRSAQR